ncbi:MAG: type II toxin-antitoxin system prevent-host-death family antitoxin [Betaproteobacteria bacterium]|nr:type II toxin-antitoxin system prevent-host-death family antitoxin [Betaproteobacteria bacterium]
MLAALAKTSALEMPENVAALLPKIRRKPIPLARNGKTAAVLVSIREYREIQKTLEFLSNYDGELTEKDERRLAREVAESRKEKPIGEKESEKLLNRILR